MKLIGYNLQSDKWYITKINGSETDITLLDTIDGNYYGIWKYALAGNYTIETLRVSSNITSFQRNAFSHSSLKNIYCGKIEPPAIVELTFADLDSPITVYVPIGSKAIYESSYFWSESAQKGWISIQESIDVDTKISIIPPLYCFQQKLSDKTVTIPEEVTTIGRMAYFRSYPIGFKMEATGDTTKHLEWDGEIIKGSTEMVNSDVIAESAFYNTDKEIPQTGTITLTSRRINQLSFQDQNKITKISIGANVEFIAFNAFQGCTSLTSMTLDAANKYYELKTINNVQYLITKPQENKDIELLWVAPKPDGINAEIYNEAINQILFDTKIKRINSCLFFNNNNIYNLIIPATVETIGYQAFMECSNICLIEFATGRLKPIELQDYCFYNIGRSQSGVEIIFPDMPMNIGHRALAFGTTGQTKAHLIIPANRAGVISTIQKYSFEQGNGKSIVKLTIDVYGNNQILQTYKTDVNWSPYFENGKVTLIEDYPIATISGNNGLIVEQDNDIASIFFNSNMVFSSLN